MTGSAERPPVTGAEPLLTDEEVRERLKARYPVIIVEQTKELAALRAEVAAAREDRDEAIARLRFYRAYPTFVAQAERAERAESDLAAARDELGRLRAAARAFVDWYEDTALTFQTKGEVEDNAWSIIDAPTYALLEQHEEAIKAALATPAPERQDEGSERGEVER